MDVNEQTIISAIKNGHNTQQKLIELLNVCVSCGFCEPSIEELINKHK